MTGELTFPHSLEAERAVLAAILVENDQMDAAQQVNLLPDQFYRDAHQRIYRALQALTERRTALDLVTVIEELRRAGDLDEAGGPAYVASLIDGVPRSMNLPHYVAIVQEQASRRALMRLTMAMTQRAAAGEESAATLLDEALQGLLDISSRRQVGQLVEGPQLAGEAISWLDEIVRRRADRRVSGASTGFLDLDQLTDGFQPGQLVIVAARPSQGKSALALQLAVASASCAFFSLEMTRMELAARELALLGRIDGWAMRKGLLSSHEHARLQSAINLIGESGVAIDDSPAISVAQLRAKARRRQITRGLALIVVDYLQLMTPARVEGRRETTREQEVAGLTRGLKATAKELQVPVVALAQLNRATEQGREKEPTLANLRESGAVEQDADVVIFVHRPDGQSVAKEGDVNLVVAKNRSGPTGTIPLRWYPSQTRFAEPAVVDEPQQGAFA